MIWAPQAPAQVPDRSANQKACSSTSRYCLSNRCKSKDCTDASFRLLQSIVGRTAALDMAQQATCCRRAAQPITRQVAINPIKFLERVTLYLDMCF
jgi:hypothetical protein